MGLGDRLVKRRIKLAIVIFCAFPQLFDELDSFLKREHSSVNFDKSTLLLAARYKLSNNCLANTRLSTCCSDNIPSVVLNRLKSELSKEVLS